MLRGRDRGRFYCFLVASSALFAEDFASIAALWL